MSICEFYAGIYVGAPLSSQSTTNSLHRQRMLGSALPELYAAVIVFAVKEVMKENRGNSEGIFKRLIIILGLN